MFHFCCASTFRFDVPFRHLKLPSAIQTTSFCLISSDTIIYTPRGPSESSLSEAIRNHSVLSCNCHQRRSCCLAMTVLNSGRVSARTLGYKKFACLLEAQRPNHSYEVLNLLQEDRHSCHMLPDPSPHISLASTYITSNLTKSYYNLLLFSLGRTDYYQDHYSQPPALQPRSH